MKNGSITDQLKMQERELNSLTIHSADEKQNRQQSDIAINQLTDKLVNQASDLSGLGLSSFFGIFSPEPANTNEEQPMKPPKKKKKRKRRIS